jgi:hypothetical protein
MKRFLQRCLDVARRSGKRPVTKRRLTVERLESRELLTVNIVFNYSLDTNGFFNDTSRRTLLDRAAEMIETRLGDTLDAITPGGSNTWTPSITHPATGQNYRLSGSTSVPADTILVYAGGRDLGGSTLGIGGNGGYSASGSTSWLNTINTRGEPGRALASPTDVAPWGGSITFDTVGTTWHFGLTTAGLDSTENDFMSVAMHELGHVLGFSYANPSFQRLAATGSFTGAAARAANGNQNVPLDASRSHFADGLKNEGMETGMSPAITTGTRKFFGTLDFAVLDDIGWDLTAANDTIAQAAQKMNKPVSGGTATSQVLFTSIESSKDVDFYRVYVGANVTLSVSLSKSGTTSIDTYLKLYDSSGALVVSANQGGIGGSDSFSKKLTRGDYYYIAVSSFANRLYDPWKIASGPGGPVAGYRLGITLA